MSKIYLNNMEFMTCHGVLPDEHITPQKFIVDAMIESAYVAKSGLTDTLDDTINYAEIYEVIQGVLEGEHCALIENLASKIGRLCVEKFPKLEKMTTKITKVNPPIPGYNGTVACEMTIERASL